MVFDRFTGNSDERPYSDCLEDRKMKEDNSSYRPFTVRDTVNKDGTVKVSNHENIREKTWYSVKLWVPKLVYDDERSKTEDFYARVTSNGYVTIPKELREEYDIQPGDFVQLDLIYKMNINQISDSDFRESSSPVPNEDDLREKFDVRLTNPETVQFKIVDYDLDWDEVKFASYITQNSAGGGQLKSEVIEEPSKGDTVELPFNIEAKIVLKSGNSKFILDYPIEKLDSVKEGLFYSQK